MGKTNRQIRNILDTYNLASTADHAAGMGWYQSVNLWAQSIGGSVSMDLARVAGVVAALSPGLRWERNQEAAHRVIMGESLVGLGIRWSANIRKAERIVGGESPDMVLRGDKVRSFWWCICDPTNPSAVCIDTHAYSIAVGKYIPNTKMGTLTHKQYAKIADNYKRAAGIVGLIPNQLQAITWTTWRRLYVKGLDHA